MRLSPHSCLLLTGRFSCHVSCCCPPSSIIKNERHSVEYQSIPKKGAHSDSVILLLVSLVILKFLVLLALVAGVAAAEDEEADGAANKENSGESVHQNDNSRHEEAVFDLISVLLLGSLDLLAPGIISHANWLLKLASGSDGTSSREAPDGSEYNPDDEIGHLESKVNCTEDLASSLLVLHEDNGEDENRSEEDGGVEAPSNPGVEDFVHLHGVARSDLDSELSGTDDCLLTGALSFIHISNNPARVRIWAIEGKDSH